MKKRSVVDCFIDEGNKEKISLMSATVELGKVDRMTNEDLNGTVKRFWDYPIKEPRMEES